MNINRPTVTNDRSKDLFIQGATPKKQIQILEIVGAMMIMKDLDRDGALELFNRALDICIKFKFKSSRKSLASYQFIRQVLNNPGAGEIRPLAMNTVARLSEGTSKLWNLISLPDIHFPTTFSSRRFYVFNILNFLSEELKRVEDFASLEEIDFYSLSQVVKVFKDWFFKELVESGGSRNNELTPDRISHVHSIVRLVIACFNKLTHVTDSNKVTDTCMKLYVTLCFVLTLLYSRFADVMTEAAFNENKILLKKLINSDLRDGDSNSLMHFVMEHYNNYYKLQFETDLVGSLLDDFEMVSVKIRNREGFEPVQLINIKRNPLSLEVFVKMADSGAHVDARNYWGNPTLREVFEKEGRPDLAFHYDSLQCACARVLVRSLVPFRNRVPKDIVDFINRHLI